MKDKFPEIYKRKIENLIWKNIFLLYFYLFKLNYFTNTYLFDEPKPPVFLAEGIFLSSS